MTQVVGKIYSTDNYEMFRHLEGNREVLGRARKYVNSIKEMGQIQPIIINELNEVVDGQARLECCKMLGINVEYIVRPGLRLAEVIDVNDNTKKWSTYETVHGYATTGSLASMYLDNLHMQFPQFEVALLYYALVGMRSNAGQIKNDISFDVVKVDDYNKAQGALSYLASLHPYIAKVPGAKKPVYTIIIWLYKHDWFDRDRLIDAIQKRFVTMAPMPNVDIALAEVEKIYNWHRTNKVFFADEYKRETEEKRQIGRSKPRRKARP